MKLLSNVFKRVQKASAKQLFILFALFLSLSVGGLVGVNAMSPSDQVDAANLSCGDSSGNSIIRNGVGGTDEASRQRLINDIKSNSNLQKIYARFGLTSSDYGRFVADAKPGLATDHKTIVVGGKVVATNVGSVGHYKGCQGPGAMTFGVAGYGDVYGNWDEQGKAFAPGTSALPVDVLFNESGAVQFAVMSNTCANPTFQPNYVCHDLNTKQSTSNKNQYTFTTNASAGNGAKITALVYNFGDGSKTVTTHSPSTPVSHTFTKDSTVSVTVYVSVPGMGTVKLTNCKHAIKFIPPPPVYVCDALDQPVALERNADGSEQYQLTAHAHGTYATIEKYIFNPDDGTGPIDVTTSATSASVKHNYKPGTYTPWVDVTFKTNTGAVHTVTSAACHKTLTVKPVATSLACTDLTLDKGAVDSNGNTKYTLTATGKATNATITSYTFYPDDASGPVTVKTNKTTASINHVYKPGTYNNIYVVVTGTDIYGHTITSSTNDCVKSLTVKPVAGTLACTGLTLSQGAVTSNGNTKYTLTATASATNATITSYAFYPGDNSPVQTVNTSATTASVNHVYKPGTYNDIHVVVTGKDIYGHTITSSTNDCVKSLTVKPLPTNLACVSLTATAGNQNQTTGQTPYHFVATASATNATITSYAFYPGDNSPVQTVNTSATTASFDHTYAVGSFKAHFTVTGTDIYGHTITSANVPACAAQFTVPPLPSTLTCVNLTLTPGDTQSDGSQYYTLNAKAATTNGATISSYTFTFGDTSQPQVVNTSATTASSDAHLYAPGNYTASVTVKGTDAQGHPLTATSPSCSAPVVVPPTQPHTPGISITKTVDGQSSEQVNVGQQFVYQLVITNTGNEDLSNVLVTDATPAGVTLLSADLGTIANNNWSYTIPSLAAGDSVTVNITAVVNTYVPGSLVNTACVTAPGVTPPAPGQPNECAHATVTVTPPATTLVNTGAGNILGLFGVSAIVGTLGYRFFLGRRLGRE